MRAESPATLPQPLCILTITTVASCGRCLLPKDPPDRLYAGRSGIFPEAPDAWMPRPGKELSSDYRPREVFCPADSSAKDTAGKVTSICPRGGQQVAENGGNERAGPRRCIIGKIQSLIRHFAQVGEAFADQISRLFLNENLIFGAVEFSRRTS